jgi:hypothetical protein
VKAAAQPVLTTATIAPPTVQPAITPPTVQPIVTPAREVATQPGITPALEVPVPVAAKPQPAVSVEPAQQVHKENWFAAHWKLIAGIAVGLVLLFVVVQAVIRNQNEKAARDAAATAAQKEKAAADELARQAGVMSIFGDSQGDATAMFVRACDAGSLHGCAEAAARYRDGNGVAPDNGRALELYRKACAGGEPNACEDMKKIPAAK